MSIAVHVLALAAGPAALVLMALYMRECIGHMAILRSMGYLIGALVCAVVFLNRDLLPR